MAHLTKALLGVTLLLAGCTGDGSPEDGPSVLDGRYDLSACGEDIQQKYADTPWVMQHRWYSAARDEYLTTTHAQWQGCAGDTREAGDGYPGETYTYDRSLALLFRPDRPPPPDTVPVYFYEPTANVVPTEGYDSFTTTDENITGPVVRRLEGYAYPADWRPGVSSGEVVELWHSTSTDRTVSPGPMGSEAGFTYVALDGYGIDPTAVDTLRPGECLTHEDCASTELCVLDPDDGVPVGPGGNRGLCEKRCFTHDDCTDAEKPRCDVQHQRCVMPFLLYDDPDMATFTRASPATYLDGNESSIASAVINELRWEDRGDGFGAQPLLEGYSANYVENSMELRGSEWSYTDVEPIGRVRGLDGTRSGVLIEASAAPGTVEGTVDPLFSGPYDCVASTWLRLGNSGASTAEFVAQGLTPSSVAIGPVTALWGRHDAYMQTRVWDGLVENLFYTGTFGLRLATLGDDFRWFGPQLEQQTRGPYPTSYIPTSGGYAAREDDSLISSSVPVEMVTDGFALDVWPYFASDEMTSHRCVFSDGTSRLCLYPSAGQVIVRVYSTGGLELETGTLEFDRHQRLRLMVSPTEGWVMVRGASNVDPEFVFGSSWTWPTTGTWYFGGNLDGRMSEPYPVRDSTICSVSAECPPDQVCSSDNLCFPSCAETGVCPAGRVCEPTSGQCNSP